MKKHIFFLIRYSIIQKTQKGWRAAEKNLEDYVKYILSDSRLDIREQMFERITIPSLKNQILTQDADSTIVIMVSDLLPKERIEKLYEITKCLEEKHSVLISRIQSGLPTENTYDHANINDATKSAIEEKLKNSGETILATVRLDDDDGLSENYIFELSKHIKNDLAGYAVSFAYGIEGYYDEKERDLSDLKHLYFPKNAQGLAYIYKYNPANKFKNESKINIYNLGNHVKIDEQFPVICYAKEPMYFRTLSKTNDSVDARYHKNLPTVQSINELKNFTYLQALISDKPNPNSPPPYKPVEISKECTQSYSFVQDLKYKIKTLEEKLKKHPT